MNSCNETEDAIFPEDLTSVILVDTLFMVKFLFEGNAMSKTEQTCLLETQV